jgi:hypothetical protein
MTMSYGQHLNDRRKLTINQSERKVLEHEFTRIVEMSRPAIRGLGDLLNGPLHFLDKSQSCQRAALDVPTHGRAKFL